MRTECALQKLRGVHAAMTTSRATQNADSNNNGWTLPGDNDARGLLVVALL
jgi:hypothetical protein